ncbi:MAG: 2-C-methyl-D-erythritol 4-phosphate cytidylyltransferase [Clostridiaceae bacterium]|nr:2-C-methyl-D-erythritol 4-phosphate cytidylyltransferase [Clostridiaceae bacterium]
MVSAIVLAGGKGKRMGSAVSKQFIHINDKPILYYTLKKFLNCNSIDKVVLVLPKDEIEYCIENVLDKYALNVDEIVVGGKERQDSVYNGLQKCKDSEVVLVHDGARPFVSENIILNGIRYAREYGATAPGVMPKDTIKVKNAEGFSIDTPNRADLVAIQTPQSFKYDLIMKCHEKIKRDNISVTDDTMVLENYGHKVYIYDGEYTNIKVTTPEDIVIAEYLAKEN